MMDYPVQVRDLDKDINKKLKCKVQPETSWIC